MARMLCTRVILVQTRELRRPLCLVCFWKRTLMTLSSSQSALPVLPVMLVTLCRNFAAAVVSTTWSVFSGRTFSTRRRLAYPEKKARKKEWARAGGSDHESIEDYTTTVSDRLPCKSRRCSSHHTTSRRVVSKSLCCTRQQPDAQLRRFEEQLLRPFVLCALCWYLSGLSSEIG